MWLFMAQIAMADLSGSPLKNFGGDICDSWIGETWYCAAGGKEAWGGTILQNIAIFSLMLVSCIEIAPFATHSCVSEELIIARLFCNNNNNYYF